MFEEFTKVARESEADGSRRWFSDDEMDLIVWYSADGALEGFQLCYDKSRRERAFEWRRGGSLRHFVVDDGESTPLRNDTPILKSGGGEADQARVLADFRTRAAKLEPAIVAAVAAAFSGR